MITVKLLANLRIKENDKHNLVYAGTEFREKQEKDFPEWLLDEIKHCRKTLARNTLLIQGSADIEQEIDSNKEDDDSKDIILDKKIKPTIKLQKRKRDK